jgi:ADP-heptose:LPS heptosyltransferase
MLSDEILNAKTETSLDVLVEAIHGLDYLVTISTTTTHIAAALGTRVELIAAEREGQQWFWRVQASHRKHFYPTVRVHLGDGRKEGWWEKSVESLKASLSKQENGGSRVR